MNETSSKTIPRRWWRFGFRLRTLFVLTALVASPLRYVVYERQRCEQQQLVVAMLDLNAKYFRDGPVYTRSDSSIVVRGGVIAKILGDNRLDQICSVQMGRFYSSVARRQMYALSHLPNLQHFAMDGAQVESSGFHYLAAFHELEHLSLIGTSITDSDLYYLSGLRKLAILQLTKSNFTDSGAAHLATLTNLKHLDLHQTKITDASVKYFAKMPNLEYLDLSDTQVSEKSVEALAQHTHLKVLALSPESFSPAARTKIRKLLPKCDIIFAKN